MPITTGSAPKALRPKKKTKSKLAPKTKLPSRGKKKDSIEGTTLGKLLKGELGNIK